MPPILLRSRLGSRCGRSHGSSSNGPAPRQKVHGFLLLLSPSHVSDPVWSPETLASMQHECSSSIAQGLRECNKPVTPLHLISLPGTVAQVNKAQMNYKNYDMQVIQKYGIKLVGWTYRTMACPSEIITIDDIRSLRDALRCGACHWIRLTKSELMKHAKEINARAAAGEVVGSKRKERSDKGVERGPRKKRAVAEKTPAWRGVPDKQKAAQGKGIRKTRTQLPPSKATISDSDEFD